MYGLSGKIRHSNRYRRWVGTVEPDFEQFTVIGTKLGNLFQEHVGHIGARGIVFVAGIPRRQIYTEFHTIFFTGFGEEFGNIDLRTYPATVRHTEIGALGRPQTETIVVLADNHGPFHTGSVHRFYPLVAIGNRLRCILFRIGPAIISPLGTHKGIGSIMRESIKLGLHPV